MAVAGSAAAAAIAEGAVAVAACANRLPLTRAAAGLAGAPGMAPYDIAGSEAEVGSCRMLLEFVLVRRASAWRVLSAYWVWKASRLTPGQGKKGRRQYIQDSKMTELLN